jgi:hypothetical protein
MTRSATPHPSTSANNVQAHAGKLPVRPRQLVHRGVLQAQALWFSTRLWSEDELRQRVLAQWEPAQREPSVANGAYISGAGRNPADRPAMLYRFSTGLLLLFPTVRRIVSEVSSATPLVAEGKTLWAAPLSPEERALSLGQYATSGTTLSGTLPARPAAVHGEVSSTAPSIQYVAQRHKVHHELVPWISLRLYWWKTVALLFTS